MNKQDKKKLTKHIELNQHMTEISMFGRTAVVDVVPSDRLIDLIDELASPVKVPKFVGELLDYYRNSTDVDLLALLICFKDWYFRKDKLSENEEAIDWLVRHPEKFMKAWLDGYEVEEEPKYRVNIGGGGGMNIRVELLARIEKSVKDEFAFGNESIPQSHWYNIEKRYESTGELGTLIQITQFTDNRRAQAVVLMDSGEFVEVDGLDTIRALEEVAE